MYASLDNLKDENFLFKKIDTNFNDVIGPDYFKKNRTRQVIKNLLIKNNTIYVSYVKKVKDNCFTTEILVSNLSIDEMTFHEFFNTDN